MSQNWPAGTRADEICASLEEGIQRGLVAPGALLPTVRQLAAALRVSPTTVAAAYKAARARGFITGNRRGGTRVAARPPIAASRRPQPIPAGLVDLASGNPDPALLPPLDAALRTLNLTPRLYGGEPDLKALVEFAAAEFEEDGIAGSHVAVVGGALDGIERALRDHLRPGDVVAIEDPGFPAIRDLVSANGWQAAPLPLDADGPAPDAFARALRRAKAVVITPRAQNPTGAALSPARASDLRRELKSHPDVLLIENDHAGPVAGVPMVSLHEVSRSWVVIRSTSKFLGPDLRVAVIAGDARTLTRIEGRQAFGMRWVSHLLQQLVVGLWSDPGSGRRLAKAADVYSQRRAVLVQALSTHGISIAARSGFNVWVPVDDEARVVQALADRGWAVAPGERFRLGTPPGIRITTATLDPADAGRLADDINTAIAGARRYHGA